MDAEVRNKALFRAKLNQKKEKRIDSPHVRYNDSDQPVCRICEIVVKPDWDIHQMSRKHREGMKNLKAKAVGQNRVNNATTKAHPELCKPNGHSLELENPEPECSPELPRPQSSSGLPPGFFDNHEPLKENKGAEENYRAVWGA